MLDLSRSFDVAVDLTKRFVSGERAAVIYKALSGAAPIAPGAEQRLVVGVVLQPTLEMGQPDSQGDLYSMAEVRNAKESWPGTVGLQHQADISAATEVVESWICPVDTTINGQTVPAGSWCLAVRVNDDVLWADVKAQRITGFSIGGSAQRVPLNQ